jgi:SAM-dependent methyltransferase
MIPSPERDRSAVAGYIAPVLYDVQYSAYREDLPFWVELARAAGGPALEVGCGTGRVHLPLLQAGVDTDGLDLLPAMLDELRRKAAVLGLAPRVHEADMRNFTLPRRYTLIVIPFRAFLHNLTTADQIATLRACRQHLETGGRLVVDLFYPSFARLIEPDGEWRLEREFPHPESGRPMSVVSRRASDRVNQTMRVEMELREHDERGAVLAAHPQSFALRWIYKPEMELLLQVAGFARWEVAGGFDGRPLLHDTDQMIWTAWKD